MKHIDDPFYPSALYLSHGGGPMPLLGDKAHVEMIENLQHIAAMIAKPSAVIVISAHWEENRVSITHAAEPPLIFDYHGYPKAAYDIEYPASGDPHLANVLFMLLEDNGIEATLVENRGFDHGVFIPLKIMYPDADIPCIQLSLVNSLDPLHHIKIGEALSKLKQEGVLIIGSGFSFHNMTAFFKPDTAETRKRNELFETWLIDTCSNKNIDEDERTRRLADWAHAPFARYCHPREEHLLPLHVCYGVAKRPCTQVFELEILAKKVSTYLW